MASNMWTRRGLVKPTFNLTGVTDLRQFLKGIDPWVQRRVIIKTVEEAGKPIVSMAKSLVSVRTGALKKSLGVVVREYPKTRNITAIIGARTSEYIIGKSGKARAAKVGDKGFLLPHKYSHLLEFGHYSAAATGQSVSSGTKGTTRRKGNFTTRSFIQGKPFLRPAFEAGKIFAENRIKEGFEIAVKREYERMQKKIAKLKILIKAA